MLLAAAKWSCGVQEGTRRGPKCVDVRCVCAAGKIYALKQMSKAHIIDNKLVAHVHREKNVSAAANTLGGPSTLVMHGGVFSVEQTPMLGGCITLCPMRMPCCCKL